MSSDLRRFFDAMASSFPGHVMQRLMRADGSVRYTYASPGIAALGLDAEAIIAEESSGQDWIHPDDKPRWRAALATSATTLAPLDEEVRVIGLDGRLRWVRSIGNPRRLRNGDTVWDGIALDVTERREALDAMRRAKTDAEAAEAQKAQLLASLHGVLDEPRIAFAAAMARGRSEAPLNTGDALRLLKLASDTFERASALLNGESEHAEAAQNPDARLGLLTARQLEVHALLCRGCSNREIAESLGISEGTVKLHVMAVLRAVGATSRAKVAAWAPKGIGMQR